MRVAVKGARSADRQEGPVDTLESLRTRTLSVRCAIEAEVILGDIIHLAHEPASERAGAILDFAVTRDDLPPIQIRAITELLVLEPDHARKLIGHLVQRPFDEDLEHVRARAYAALVELPDPTQKDVALLEQGLKSSRAARDAITRALEAQRTPKLEALKAVVGQQRPGATPPIVKLKAVLESAHDSSHEARWQPERVARIVHADTRPKQEKSVISAPPVPRRPKPAAERTLPRVGTKRGERAGTPAAIAPSVPPVSPPAPKSSPVSDTTMQLSLPPRPVEQATNAGLDSLREPRFHSMAWRELLAQRDSIRDPHMLCACFAEMASRFDRELAQDAVATRLVWIVSHPEPELKRKASLIVRALF